jgi:hypothetical protein
MVLNQLAQLPGPGGRVLVTVFTALKVGRIGLHEQLLLGQLGVRLPLQVLRPAIKRIVEYHALLQ